MDYFCVSSSSACRRPGLSAATPIWQTRTYALVFVDWDGGVGGGGLSCPLTPPLSVNIWHRVCVKVAEVAVSVVSERKEMNRIRNRFWKEERVHRGASQSIGLDPHSSPALSPSLKPLPHASAGLGPSGDALTGHGWLACRFKRGPGLECSLRS